jgi:isocitrate dehydrogenase
MTSNLMGKAADGTSIQEFEASHGTVTDMWNAHLRGDETSLNPLGLVEALLGAMRFATQRAGPLRGDAQVLDFCDDVRSTIHRAFVSGHGTRDICGDDGLSTEAFIEIVGAVLDKSLPKTVFNVPRAKRVKPSLEKSFRELDDVLVRKMFNDLDENNDGVLDLNEFMRAVVRLGVQPKSFVFLSKEQKKVDKF